MSPLIRDGWPRAEEYRTRPWLLGPGATICHACAREGWAVPLGARADCPRCGGIWD